MVNSISLLNKNSVQTADCNLPGEVWRVILSFLRAGDLCRCSLVSKEWNLLVQSIDSTRWKSLYLEQSKHKRWKHPFWPNDTSTEPQSWKECYSKRYEASRLWLLGELNPSCTTKFFFTKKRRKQKFCVGFNKQYRTIKSALDKASPYDSIYVYPGLYQDPITLVIKFPCAIIGVDDASKIQLAMQIDIRADSVKLENLTVKPMYPRVRGRSSSFNLVKIYTGRAYIFNCVFDQGHVHVVSPGIAELYSCMFTTAFINLQGIAYSSIKNCEFQPDRFAIFVEEPLFQFRSKPPVTLHNVGGWVSALNEKQFEECYRKSIKEKYTENSNISQVMESNSKSLSSLNTDSEISFSASTDSKSKTKSAKSRLGSLKSLSNKDELLPVEEVLDSQAKMVLKAVQGVIINNVKVTGGRGAITLCRMGQAWIEKSTFHNTTFGIRCLQNSKCIMLSNKIYECETTGIFLRDHSLALIAGNEVFANGEAGIDIRSSADPIIQHNEIHGGQRSGIVCLDNGKGLIRENNIYKNAEAAIYILHKGCPKVKNNHIWSGRAAGIAVTEDGRGHISNNIISGMEWAGIDIRHGGNPVVSHNMIRNGKSDGIVVGEAGKSVILDNTIEDNSGCGIWILDGSHPLIHSNRILNSGNSGIAFVENIDHEHTNHYRNIQPRHGGQAQVDVDEPVFLADEEFGFLLPALEQEPESRYVHVSKPEKKLPQVEANIIENNKGHGILYEGKEGLIISKNKINYNHQHAINLLHNSEIIIENNTLSNNHLSGINVELGVNSVIQGNGIYDNNEYGVMTAGITTIKENDIFGHSVSGVVIRSMADVLMQKNRLHAAQHCCVLLEEKSRCLLRNNEFYISPEAREVSTHSVVDIDYDKDENVTHVIERVGSCEHLNEIGVRDLLSEIKQWRPLQKEVEEGTAPYFTAVQLKNQTQRLHISAFCTII